MGTETYEQMRDLQKNHKGYTGYLAMFDWCWGRGPTIKEALRQLRISHGRNGWKDDLISIYLVHPDTVVTNSGGMQHPLSHPPIELNYAGGAENH